ncbi:TetR family transcriptional regulator [Subtercola boreus]|uniref:TetR family transcriptional regulator n=1 Tax=Subtercola boreus TaxID=120213 RepID=A0A3E0VH55_9MICO|nr:TetR/AcrR family transcriptional regulator [Subtercola boreus]RFA09266.1 TetR family transcriptional regulator [Subtercola boreus]
MPTPDRTSLDAIVMAARDLLEQDGLPGLTMQAVAERVGVRAPSLYKRVRNRDDLIRLVAEATLVELAAELDAANGARKLLGSFRAFGLGRPAAFRLIMTPGDTPSAAAVSEALAETVSAGILRTARELAGEQDALFAARTLTAWAAGFVSMELNGGFNLGGDPEDAWEYGLERIVAAISAKQT